MKFKRFASGFYSGLGILLLLAAIHSHYDRTIPKTERQNQSSACLLLGLPFTFWGAWSAWSVRQQQQQQEQERLRSVFFGLIQRSSTITPLQFAIAAEVSGTVAKQFLSKQAEEFAADFNIGDLGDLSYRFNVGHIENLKQLQPLPPSAAPSKVDAGLTFSIDSSLTGETFDVILELVPPHQRIAVIRSLRQLTNADLREAKARITHLPNCVKSNVSWAEAEACQRQLRLTGAIAKIVINR